MNHFKPLTGLALAASLALSAPAFMGESALADCGAAHGDAKHELSAIFPTAQEAGFKTLTAAIQAAGLQEVLTEKGPFTVFAPTDEAFAKLPEGTVEALLKDKEALKNILLYHVVAGEVSAKEVVKLKSAQMLNGASVSIVSNSEGVRVNGVNVIQTDIAAKNGVIHVIDTVLIPSNES